MTVKTDYDEPLYIVWRASGPQGTTGWHHGRSVEGWLGDPDYADALREQRRFVRENVRSTEMVADNDRIQTKVVGCDEYEALGI